MKPEIKQMWVEALRSGKYKQGQYRLRRNDDSFCCLGVLCDVVDHSSWSSHLNEDSYSYDDQFLTISESMKKYVELEVEECRDLVNLNDGCAKSFSEIADYIEENL